jgi:hypothetical protein
MVRIAFAFAAISAALLTIAGIAGFLMPRF